jgi:hypothetical protein
MVSCDVPDSVSSCLRKENHSATSIGESTTQPKVYVLGDFMPTQLRASRASPKGGIGGGYSVGSGYLQSYLDEYSYRYNRRDQGNLILKSILGEVSKPAVD